MKSPLEPLVRRTDPAIALVRNVKFPVLPPPSALLEIASLFGLIVGADWLHPGIDLADIRPHPFFPTIEFRICDVPLRLDETIALAALMQATVAKLYKLHTRNQDYRQYSRALLMENKWRALRYGIDGKLIDFGKQQEVPFRELMQEYLDFVDDVVDEVGCRRELDYVQKMLERGTGADRQLRVFKESGGDLKAVVDYMVAETLLPSEL